MLYTVVLCLHASKNDSSENLEQGNSATDYTSVWQGITSGQSVKKGYERTQMLVNVVHFKVHEDGSDFKPNPSDPDRR